jgi:Ser/Thr protein kinase RdoA (MazF antagonist)
MSENHAYEARQSVPLDALFVQTHWPLSSVQLKEILQQSGERQVGIVESEQGRFVYKIAESRRGEAGLRQDTAVFSALERVGFSQAPKLIPTAEGERFIKLGSRFVYLLERIEGSRPESSPETYSEIGKITGRLHLTRGFPFETDFNTNKILEDLYKNATDYTFGKEYQAIGRSLQDLETFPKTIIHTDISPANSIRHPKRGIVFIDWDDAGTGPAVVDLGAMLNEIIREDITFNESYIRAFFSSYTKERQIAPREVDGIVDATIFFALMYIPYGNMEKRWERIKWLHANKKELKELVSGFSNPSI